MTSRNLIFVNAKLGTNLSEVPVGGLMQSKIRVELSEENNSESSWISELIILGDLPWHMGESRKVEVRIMSEEFRTRVMDKQPSMLIRYGSQIIGSLLLI